MKNKTKIVVWATILLLTIGELWLLMKYTKEGPIFQKQIYSRWKEEQAKAKAKQLTIIIPL